MKQSNLKNKEVVTIYGNNKKDLEKAKEIFAIIAPEVEVEMIVTYNISIGGMIEDVKDKIYEFIE